MYNVKKRPFQTIFEDVIDAIASRDEEKIQLLTNMGSKFKIGLQLRYVAGLEMSVADLYYLSHIYNVLSLLALYTMSSNVQANFKECLMQTLSIKYPCIYLWLSYFDNIEVVTKLEDNFEDKYMSKLFDSLIELKAESPL